VISVILALGKADIERVAPLWIFRVPMFPPNVESTVNVPVPVNMRVVILEEFTTVLESADIVAEAKVVVFVPFTLVKVTFKVATFTLTEEKGSAVSAHPAP
jgi:hypothetical protein